MKRHLIMLLSLFLLFGGKAAAQSEGIRFVEGKTFAEALQLAKENGKMLFLDCYTSWCGPCKMMARDVFTQKAVGDYFNEEFVSIKIDMEKGEGPELRARFGVRAYPTFLFFDGDGKELNRIVGGGKADKWLADVKKGVGANSMSALTARYEKGDRDLPFLSTYLDVLSKAYANDKAGEVAAEMLNNREKEMLANETLYRAFMKYVPSPLSPSFQYVLDHQDEFAAKYDAVALERKISMAWMAFPRTLITKSNDGSVEFDRVTMDAFVKEMEKRKVENRDEVVLMSEISLAEAKADWKQFAKLCDKYINKFGADDMYLFNWVLRIEKNSQDPKTRAKAIKWMEKRLKEIEAEKANQEPLPEGAIRAMPMVDYSAQYNRLIDSLKK